jgi:heat shock protein HtpX
MKRIVLFLATNLAVVLVLSVVLKLFGLDRAVAQSGIAYGPAARVLVRRRLHRCDHLAAHIEPVAKWSTGAHVIEQPQNEAEAWLMETVRRLATKAGIGMPEVAIYEGEPNAFATGAFKNSALVAVSTGLLQSMNKEEVEAVLGHEVATSRTATW